MEKIRIVTINTWKCDGNYHLRLPLMIKALQLLQPHIIACQECFLSEEANADTLKFLAAGLNMHHTFVSGRLKKRLFNGQWVDSQSGLGILSVYPFAVLKEFLLPGSAGDDDRKAQQAGILLPWGETLLITNTHLTHLGDSDGTRKIQAEALARLVTAANAYRYHIICGDFNATSTSAEIKIFTALSGAADCYTAGDGTEPSYTLADAFIKGKMIAVDHIFALPIAGTGKHPEFINSAVVLNQRDGATGLYPSDHFGISTTLLCKN